MSVNHGVIIGRFSMSASGKPNGFRSGGDACGGPENGWKRAPHRIPGLAPDFRPPGLVTPAGGDRCAGPPRFERYDGLSAQCLRNLTRPLFHLGGRPGENAFRGQSDRPQEPGAGTQGGRNELNPSQAAIQGPPPKFLFHRFP